PPGSADPGPAGDVLRKGLHLPRPSPTGPSRVPTPGGRGQLEGAGPCLRQRTDPDLPGGQRTGFGTDRPGRGHGTAAGRRSAGSAAPRVADRKSTRLNSSHVSISYAVFCLKKKN